MNKVLKAALTGGSIGGAIDLAYACIVSYAMSGATPDRIFRYVGAGWVGLDAARANPLAIAVLGFVSHFAICIAFALAYCLVSLRVPLLRRQALICGGLFGALVYVLMNYVIVPNSALAGIHVPPTGWRLAGELASHVLGVGFAIALAARAIMGRN